MERLSDNYRKQIEARRHPRVPSAVGNRIRLIRAIEMENFKRSVKRLLTRLTILGLVVICGAIAIAQAQRERTIANAAGPDLAKPVAALQEAGEAALNALEVPGETPVAKPATWNQAAPVVAKLDAPDPVQVSDVRTVGFDAPVDPPADSGPAAVANRFSTPGFDNSASAPSAEPPPLYSGNETTASSGLQSPLPPADTSLPAFGDSPPDFGADNVPQPGAQPAPLAEPPGVTNRDVFTGTNSGLQPPPSGNRLRSGNVALPRNEPAPVASAPPSFDSPPTFEQPQTTPPPRQDLPQSNIQDQVLPPARSYAKSSLSLSGAGKPGPRELEGVQSPTLSIQKIAPKDVRVDEPTTFKIRVRNNGQIPAERVLIRDEVPLGTQLVDTNPQATTDANGAVIWEVGTLRPSEDVTVSMQVVPSQEGLIGSVASVTFQALASARAEVKKPMLEIEHTAKGPVMVGDKVHFEITVTNPGTGPARDVVIEEDIPQGLYHTKGPKLKYPIGTIPAGGRRRLELLLDAKEAGVVENLIYARSSGGLVAKHPTQVQIVAPALQVKIEGPSRRYLERKANYTVAIENPGTADAKGVELVTQLPAGLKYVDANNSGRYDATTNSIRWSLDRLPARQYGEVQFTAIPMRKGDFNIRAEASGSKGLSDAKDHRLVVEGLAALLFEVADQVDPIEVGGVTTYQIRVHNQGTEQANNVQFVATVPPGLRAVAPSGTSKYQIQGNRVVFESIPALPAKGESVYSVRVEGVTAGDQRFTVHMKSDTMTKPVVEEESTRVYAD